LKDPAGSFIKQKSRNGIRLFGLVGPIFFIFSLYDEERNACLLKKAKPAAQAENEIHIFTHFIKMTEMSQVISGHLMIQRNAR